MKRKKINEKYSEEELAESFVFRNNLSKKELIQTAYDIAEARAKRKLQSDKSMERRFKLLQLKYQMEDAIQKPFNEEHTFGYF